MIAHADVTKTHELNEQFFDQVECILVSGNLSHKQRLLDLLKVPRFLVRVSLSLCCKLTHILIVLLLREWVLLYVHDDLLEGLREAAETLHEHVLVAGLLGPELNALISSDHRLRANDRGIISLVFRRSRGRILGRVSALTILLAPVGASLDLV